MLYLRGKRSFGTREENDWERLDRFGDGDGLGGFA